MQKIFLLTLSIFLIGIVFGAMADGSNVSRSFLTSSVQEGEVVTVTLDVVLKGVQSYFLIEEEIPAGFSVVDNGGLNNLTPGFLKTAIFSTSP